MEKKTIIITLEVGDREYDAVVLLASKFLSRDYRVIIGTNRALKILESCLEKCILLHKSTIEKYARRYQKTLGAKVCFLDVESGVTIPVGRYENWCNERFATVNSDKYNTVFTIGDVYNQYMREMHEFEGVSIVASGWPRLDLLHSSYRSFYDQRVAQIKEQYGDFILVISSFGFVTYDEFNKWSLVNKKFFGDDFVSPAWEYMKKFVDLTKKLASQGKQQVVLRPHPAEFIKSWNKKLGEVPNLSIICEGDIVPWLIAAKRIVQFRSSTALEASLLGRENLALEVDSKKYETDSPVFRLNKEFKDDSALLDHILNAVEDVETVKMETKNILSGYVAGLDGTASQRIVEEIDRIELSSVGAPKLSFFRKIKHLLFMKMADSVELLFFNTILSPPSWKYLFSYKRKLGIPITIETCQDRLDRLSVGRETYKITSLSRDLVQLDLNRR